MKKLLVAAIVLLMASPAFAAIQNVKVSGDITGSWIYDNSLNFGTTAGSIPAGQTHQNVFITQTRLRVDADLSDNVSATVGLINERAWNAENSSITSTSASTGGIVTTTTTTNNNNSSNDTNVQLYLASLTLREFLYSPLTLTIGRQVFNYGNGLIMGDGGPVNAAGGNLANIFQEITERTAYDGVKAILDYKPLTIDLMYFKNAQTLGSIDGVACSAATGNTGVNCSHQNSDVFGWNANYQLSDPWNTVVEQYMFARVNGNGLTETSNGGVNLLGTASDKGDTLFVPGLRASTNPIKGLNVQGEIAWQLGKKTVTNVIGAGPALNEESERRDAMALQLLASYSLPVLEKYKPTVNAAYTYVSGDKNGSLNYTTDSVKSAKTYSAWDEFNTIQGAGTIYRELFPLSNEHIVSVGASVAPLEDVTAAVTWSGLWAAQRYDGSQNPLVLLQPNGTAATPNLNADGYWLGNETDLNLTYNYTEDVTFGLNLGWFVPGDTFAASNHNTATQAIADVGVKF